MADLSRLHRADILARVGAWRRAPLVRPRSRVLARPAGIAGFLAVLLARLAFPEPAHWGRRPR
jgi:hypothetical protein